MKKLLLILCALSLLLCGCNSQPQAPTTLSHQPLPDPMDPAKALEDFEAMLDYAIRSDDLGYLELYSVTLPPRREELIITDAEAIRSLLTKLDELELGDPIRHEGNMTGLVYRVSLGFENGTVELCKFSEQRIYVEYYGRNVEYHLPICDPQAVKDIFEWIESQIPES